MNIIHITPEALPFSSTGSLAETLFGLPCSTAKTGCKVSVISPLYACVDIEKYNIKSTQLKTWVDAGFAVYEYEIYETVLNGVRYVFFKNDELFNRIDLYGMGTFDYADNDIRFGTFNQAVLNYLKYHNIEADIVHCHNWQTALIPVYKKLNFPDLTFKTVFTIHSIDNLGVFSKFTLESLNLPWDIYNIDNIEYYDNISFLKGGIVFADALTTVSPHFAEELISNEGSIGVSEIFVNHTDKLTGILNGICENMWNPETDPNIPANFSVKDVRGKKVCKDVLCKELGFDSAKPLAVFIQKLVPERGLDLLIDAADAFKDAGINLIILGRSNPEYTQKLQEINDKYDNIKVKFDDHANKSQREFAAADIVVMPSVYEPCGISQMIGMRYGAIPVPRKTGGLIDGAAEAVKANAGFMFDDFNVEAMMGALKQAADIVLSDKRDETVKKLLGIDKSWHHALKKYMELYEKLLEAK